jgi:hypothetical protein
MEKQSNKSSDKGDDSTDEGQHKNVLLLNGKISDFHIDFEPQTATRLDLWDRICKSSEFYPGIDAQLPAIRRGKLLDAMLDRQGQPMVFFRLTDEKLLQFGNAFTDLMRSLVGDIATNDAISGRQTLEALGLTEALKQFTSELAESPITFDPKVYMRGTSDKVEEITPTDPVK